MWCAGEGLAGGKPPPRLTPPLPSCVGAICRVVMLSVSAPLRNKNDKEMEEKGKREERRTSRQASAQRWHAPRSRVPKPREKILISARLPCPGAQLASSSLTRTAPFSGLRRSCFSWRGPCDVRALVHDAATTLLVL